MDEPTAVTQEDRDRAGDFWRTVAGDLEGKTEPPWDELEALSHAFAECRLAAEAKASIVPDAGMVEVVKVVIVEALESGPVASSRGSYVWKKNREVAGIAATAAIHALSPYFDKARREGIERVAKVARDCAESYGEAGTAHLGREVAKIIATAILALPSGPDDGAGRG